MAIERFRSIEEMNAARVRTGSDDGFDRFIRHCARYRSMAPRVRSRGVFKFRSLEEAQRARLSLRSASVRSDQDAEAGD
jgi:hypothetical protein